MTRSQHESRQKLLEASLRVFRQKGYAASRIEDVCEEAGLTKGSFFHHFKGKEDLAVASAGYWSELTGGLFAQAPYQQIEDPLERFLGYLDFRKAILGGPLDAFTCLAGTLVQEVYGTHPAIREACERSIVGHAETVAKDIAAARERYAPDAAWTAESLALYTQAVLQGSFVLAKARGGPAVAEDCVDHLRRYVEMLFERGNKETIKMANKGKFIWYELTAKDPAAAAEFYKGVFGWTVAPFAPGTDYLVISAGGIGIGGIMAPPPGTCEGAPPCWSGYMGVDDVDAAVAGVEAAGGKVFAPPFDVPNVGRLAAVADCTGSAYMLIKGSQPGDMPVAAPGTAGTIGWHELHAGDGPRAWEFYSSLYGWEKGFAMDMGPMGVYQTYKMPGGGEGGMMTKMPDCPAPFWLFYVNVEGVDATVEKVTAGGGKLVMGPMEVPGGQWVAQCTDPQGVFFAMVAPKK